MLNFCKEILTQTRELHRKAEESLLMKKYIDKQISLREHAANVFQQMGVYKALEEGLENAEFSAAFTELLPILKRQEALKRDYAYLKEKLGTTLPAEIIYLQTQQFIDHLRQNANQPFNLLAQAYVLYRGLLNGGYILQRTIQSLLKVDKNVDEDKSIGTEFYTFDQALFRLDEKFRVATNELEENLDKKKFISEVNAAYHFSIEIFNHSTNGQEQLKQSSNSNNFWQANRKLILPIAVTGLTVATGIMIAKLALG